MQYTYTWLEGVGLACSSAHACIHAYTKIKRLRQPCFVRVLIVALTRLDSACQRLKMSSEVEEDTVEINVDLNGETSPEPAEPEEIVMEPIACNTR